MTGKVESRNLYLDWDTPGKYEYNPLCEEGVFPVDVPISNAGALPPPIVNRDARDLSLAQQNGAVQPIDIQGLFSLIEQEFAKRPDIDPVELGQELTLIPHLLSSLEEDTHKSIIRQFLQYLSDHQIRGKGKEKYMHTLREVLKQQTLNGPMRDEARAFHENGNRYLEEVTYQTFRDAIELAKSALLQTEWISRNHADVSTVVARRKEINKALFNIENLRKLLVLGTGQERQRMECVLQNVYPGSLQKFATFSSEVYKRERDSPLNVLTRSLRLRAEVLKKLQKTVLLTNFLQIEARAVERAGLWILRAAVSHSPKHPAVTKCCLPPDKSFTDQQICQIWCKVAPNLDVFLPETLIGRALKDSSLDLLNHIDESLSLLGTGDDRERQDRKTSLFFNAFAAYFTNPVTLNSLKDWCVRGLLEMQ